MLALDWSHFEHNVYRSKGAGLEFKIESFEDDEGNTDGYHAFYTIENQADWNKFKVQTDGGQKPRTWGKYDHDEAQEFIKGVVQGLILDDGRDPAKTQASTKKVKA